MAATEILVSKERVRRSHDKGADSEESLDQYSEIRPLASAKTAIFKLVSAALALLGGASIGREGPTAQICAAIFQSSWFGFRKRFRYFGLREALVAGAASGIAAAFNAPIAGILFAVEELAPASFTVMRTSLLFSIVVAGATAQGLLGNYVYFGKHELGATLHFDTLLAAVISGAAAATIGALFYHSYFYIRNSLKPIIAMKTRSVVAWPILCGIAIAAICYLTEGATIGPGRELALEALNGSRTQTLFTAAAKTFSTLLSFSAGFAGGIFAPSLSMCAVVGNLVHSILPLDLVEPRLFALAGMVGMLTALTRAPLTSAVIALEMSFNQESIVPLIAAALASQTLSYYLQGDGLYHCIAHDLVEQIHKTSNFPHLLILSRKAGFGRI